MQILGDMVVQFKKLSRFSFHFFRPDRHEKPRFLCQTSFMLGVNNVSENPETTQSCFFWVYTDDPSSLHHFHCVLDFTAQKDEPWPNTHWFLHYKDRRQDEWFAVVIGITGSFTLTWIMGIFWCGNKIAAGSLLLLGLLGLYLLLTATFYSVRQRIKSLGATFTFCFCRLSCCRREYLFMHQTD